MEFRSEEQDSNTMYTALAEGTDVYAVQVVLMPDGKIAKKSCTCPYDYGPICKHIVGLFLLIEEHQTTDDEQQIQDMLSTNADKRHNAPPKKKRITQVEKFQNLLQSADRERLTEALQEVYDADTRWRKILIATLQMDDAALHKAHKVKWQAVYYQCRGRDGFIEYGDEWPIAQTMQKSLDMAEKLIKDKKHLVGFELSRTAAEAAHKYILDADDSNGNLGDVLDRAIFLMSSIDPDWTEVSQKIYKYCLKNALTDTYTSFSDEADMVGMGWNHAQMDDEIQALIDAVETYLQTTKHPEFHSKLQDLIPKMTISKKKK